MIAGFRTIRIRQIAQIRSAFDDCCVAFKLEAPVGPRALMHKRVLAAKK